MTKSTRSALTAEAAIAEQIIIVREEILDYAHRYFHLTTSQDVAVFESYGRIETCGTLETEIDVGYFVLSEAGKLEVSEETTYKVEAVPDSVVSHIAAVTSNLSELEKQGFLSLALAYFRLWQADEDVKRSDFFRAIKNLLSAEYNLSEGMKALEIEWPGYSEIRSRIARKVVDQRYDQQLKPIWKAHCRRTVKLGLPINTIKDLINAPGYDHRMKDIDEPSLKRWAKELGIGIEFKSGRPKKNR